jgi:hypothetical protein
MEVEGDAIIFSCQICGFDVSVTTGDITEESRFLCQECGADYGTWQEFKIRLISVLMEQDSDTPGVLKSVN